MKMKRKNQMECLMCGKDTQVKAGWHLKKNTNFCSDKCVAEFIENYVLKLIQSGAQPLRIKHGDLYRCYIRGALGCSHEKGAKCECICHRPIPIKTLKAMGYEREV